MTDRELLELAAKAAGIEGQFIDEPDEFQFYPDDSDLYGVTWNPLTDDGDALRLAVKLGIAITPYPIYVQPKHAVIAKQYRHTDSLREPNPTEVIEAFKDDQDAATRRAIVRAAAEIGKARA